MASLNIGFVISLANSERKPHFHVKNLSVLIHIYIYAMANKFVYRIEWLRNRHTDFALASNISQHIKNHLRQPTNEKEQKRKNRVEDMTETPKQIFGNEAHRRKVRQIQDAMNYRAETDRMHSFKTSGRVPANKERLYRARQCIFIF